MNEYPLDPALNEEKVLQLTPPLEIDRSKLPNLPKSWLKELEKKLQSLWPVHFKHNVFDKHVGKASNYKYIDDLTYNLSFIYYRMFGHLNHLLGTLSDSEVKSIALKIYEQIDGCSAGFHNRLLVIVNSFVIPLNINQLLYRVRQSIIEHIAISNTTNVHGLNDFTVVAYEDGLGVKANFERDAYHGHLSARSIQPALQQGFKEKYTALNLPMLLEEQLRGILLGLGYIGYIDSGDGYSFNTVENLVTSINRYLLPNSTFQAIPWQAFFILEKHTDNRNVIIDNLEDKLDDDFSNTYIRDLDWRYIRKKLWCVLRKESYIIHDEKTIYQSLFEKNGDGFNALMLVIQTSSAATKVLLDFIDQQSDEMDSQALSTMLLRKNTNGLNVLMLAIHSSYITTQVFLSFLDQQSDKIDLKTLSEMLLQKNNHGSNALMLALQCSPKAADMLLDFLGQYSNKFDSKTMTKILLEKNANGWNALALAKSYCPATTVKTICTLLSRHKYHQLFNKLAALNPKQAKDIDGMGALIDNNSHYLLKHFSKKHFANNSVNLALVTKKLLVKYLKELDYREKHQITHTTRFFKINLGYSTQKKMVAAKQLKLALDQRFPTVQNLINLKKEYAALTNGRLNKLFEASLTSVKTSSDRLVDMSDERSLRSTCA